MTRITGDDEILRKLRALEGAGTLRAAAQAAAIIIETEAKIYPPGANAHRPQPFKSAKQRRGFFARLRAGEIEVPYRRGMSPNSETHSKRWQTHVSGGRARITNDSSYGPLLQDPRRQTRYHRQTGWHTTKQVVERRRDDALRAIKRVIDRAIG